MTSTLGQRQLFSASLVACEFAGPPLGNLACFKSSRGAAGCTFVASFFLWPVVCLRLLGEYAPGLGVRLGLRPAWSVKGEGEETSHRWYLKDGTVRNQVDSPQTVTFPGRRASMGA